MPDPRLYESNTFVLLEPNQAEQFLTRSELLEKLTTILSQRQDDLPRDLQRFSSLSEQAEYLLDTSCELDMGPEAFLQWYVVRLEK